MSNWIHCDACTEQHKKSPTDQWSDGAGDLLWAHIEQAGDAYHYCETCWKHMLQTARSARYIKHIYDDKTDTLWDIYRCFPPMVPRDLREDFEESERWEYVAVSLCKDDDMFCSVFPSDEHGTIDESLGLSVLGRNSDEALNFAGYRVHYGDEEDTA